MKRDTEQFRGRKEMHSSPKTGVYSPGGSTGREIELQKLYLL